MHMITVSLCVCVSVCECDCMCVRFSVNMAVRYANLYIIIENILYLAFMHVLHNCFIAYLYIRVCKHTH